MFRYEVHDDAKIPIPYQSAVYYKLKNKNPIIVNQCVTLWNHAKFGKNIFLRQSWVKSIISQDIENSILAIAPTDVIEKYCNKANNIFKKIKNNTEQISTLTSLRDYLLPLLMNGQVEIKE